MNQTLRNVWLVYLKSGCASPHTERRRSRGCYGELNGCLDLHVLRPPGTTSLFTIHSGEALRPDFTWGPFRLISSAHFHYRDAKTGSNICLDPLAQELIFNSRSWRLQPSRDEEAAAPWVPKTRGAATQALVNTQKCTSILTMAAWTVYRQNLAGLAPLPGRGVCIASITN